MLSVARHDDDAPHKGISGFGRLKGSGGLAAACRVLPRVLLFAFWQQFYAYFSGDPFSSYVMTGITCPMPLPPNCSEGSHLVAGECVPWDRFNPSWSLSAKCADKDYVLETTARVNGLNGWIAAFFGLFAVFIAGNAMDTFGRKPMLMAFLSSNVFVKALLFASCFMSESGFFAVLFLQNLIEVACSAGVEPALNSMIADLTRGNEKLRSDGFAALGVMMHAADVIAFIAGYPVLKLHLTSYAWFWGPLTLVSLLAYAVFSFSPCSKLRETLHRDVVGDNGNEAEDGFSCSSFFKVFFSEIASGFRLICLDPFLAQFLILWAFTGQALGGSWNLAQFFLLKMGYEQANASMARPAWHLALMLGAALSSRIVRCFGARGSFAGSLLTMAVGFFLCGLGGPFPEHAELLFWLGTVVIGGIGNGVLATSFSAIISVRVSEQDQGKLFSSVIVVNTIVGLAVGQLWPQLFFDAKAVGWRKGAPWIASAVVFILMFMWLCVLCVLPCCNAKAGKAESDDGESSDEPATSDSEMSE